MPRRLAPRPTVHNDDLTPHQRTALAVCRFAHAYCQCWDGGREHRFNGIRLPSCQAVTEFAGKLIGDIRVWDAKERTK